MSTVVPSLRQLACRALPQALEAAVVPAVLFLLASSVAGPRAAILAPLGWALGATWWRTARRRRVPGMMVLALITLVARSAIAFAADSTFLYFLQPTLGGLALGFAFLGSVVIDRPLVRRFADDFATLPQEVFARPSVHRCFRRLSLAWGVYGLANAGLGLLMLTSLSTTAYVMVRTPLSILGTAAMVAMSALWFRRTVEPAPGRDDALVEAGSNQGVRAVWPGPASIR